MTSVANTATTAVSGATSAVTGGTAGVTGTGSGTSAATNSLGLGGAAGGAAASGSAGSSSFSTPGSGPQVKNFEASRPWIATKGEKNRRVTTLTFVLTRPGRVVFTVKQVSPQCRTIGRFSIRGHAGLNRVRFAGRVGRRELGPGTYQITARTRTGRWLRHVTIVVIEGAAPTKAELAALRAANTCPSSDTASTVFGSTGASNAIAVSDAEGSLSPEQQAAANGPTGSGLGGVLGSGAVEKTARAVRPALIALLAASILLLGLASLRQVAFADARINDALARHRTEIAGVGAVALVAVVIAFLVG